MSGLTAKIINIHTTTACTLKCKHCGWYYPYFPKVVNENVNDIINSLPVIFQIFDHVDEFRIAGAEAFLHPDFEKIVTGSAKYGDQFDTMLVITNGTFIPRKSVIESMRNLPCNFFVRIDDYGADLSVKAHELMELLQDNDISCDYRTYFGDSQFADGWYDTGKIEFISDASAYTEDVFKRCNCCAHTGEYTLWEGRLYGCGYAAVSNALGVAQPADSDFVDLLSEQAFEQKLAIIQGLSLHAYEACKYCHGRDREKAARFPAAEQMED